MSKLNLHSALCLILKVDKFKTKENVSRKQRDSFSAK